MCMAWCGLSDSEHMEQGTWAGESLFMGSEPERDEESICEKCAGFLSLNKVSKSVLYMGVEESGMGC